MPTVHDLTPSLNAGELSPRLAARVDFSKFPSGAETVQNFQALAEGGITRRPGSRFAAATKTSSVKSRLKRFEFSTTQAYILEYGVQYIRFFRNQGQIFANDITASIANGTFTGNITNWTDVSSGGGSITHDAVNDRLNLVGSATSGHAEQQVTNALAVEHVIRFQVLGAPEDFVTLQVGTATKGTQLISFKAFTGYHAIAFTATAADFFVQFVGPTDKTVQIDDVLLIDNAPIEVGTPYAEADLFAIEGPQSADVLYQFHNSYPTHKLERRGHTTWSFVEVAYFEGPYIAQNKTATTLTPSAASGKGINITASSVEGINGGLGFLSTDIGRLVRIDNAASGVDWGSARITAITSTTIAVADVSADRPFSATTADVNWRLGSWSSTTGYPGAATFFEQRLYTGNSTDQPQTFWASQTDDFENFTPDSDPDTDDIFNGTVEADDAITYTLSANDVNAIFWFSAGEDGLSIGTSGGVWVPSSEGAALTPIDIAVKRQVSSKCANIEPVRIDQVVLYVQRAKRKVLEFAFTFETDGFKANDMTRLAQHITKGGLIEMSYAEEPDSQAWAIRNDGVLLSLAFRRNEDVVGWTRNILGGVFANGNAVVESVTVIPGSADAGQVLPSDNRDEVWIQVKRTINSLTTRHIEFLETQFETGDDQTDAFYADSGITYDGVSTATITGLDHLEGEVVKIWGDGSIQASKTVSSGSITLDTAVTKAQIGLGYFHLFKSLRFEGGNPAGTSVGKIQRIFGISFILLDSHTLTFGPSLAELTTKDFRQVSDAMDEFVPLFTGSTFEEFPGDWSDDPRLFIQSDDPAPFTLLALAPERANNALK